MRKKLHWAIQTRGRLDRPGYHNRLCIQLFLPLIRHTVVSPHQSFRQTVPTEETLSRFESSSSNHHLRLQGGLPGNRQSERGRLDRQAAKMRQYPDNLRIHPDSGWIPRTLRKSAFRQKLLNASRIRLVCPSFPKQGGSLPIR